MSVYLVNSIYVVQSSQVDSIKSRLKLAVLAFVGGGSRLATNEPASVCSELDHWAAANGYGLLADFLSAIQQATAESYR